MPADLGDCPGCGERNVAFATHRCKPPFELRINVNEGVHYKCADCGSPNILIEIDQPDFEKMCNHAHPMGPPGRVVFSHPLDEPCSLRFSVLEKELVLHPRSPGRQGWGFGHGGVYVLRKPWTVAPLERVVVDYVPRKRKVSWGSKKNVLTLIRKTHPWIIEKWWPADGGRTPHGRWYMYMEKETWILPLASRPAPQRDAGGQSRRSAQAHASPNH